MLKLKAIEYFVRDQVVKSEFKLGPSVSKTNPLCLASAQFGKLHRPVEIRFGTATQLKNFPSGPSKMGRPCTPRSSLAEPLSSLDPP